MCFKKFCNRFWALILSFSLAASLIVACSTDDNQNENPAPGELVKSDKQRVTSPVADPNDLATQVGGNSEFAFDLYQQIRSQQGNLFYSPYSISIALAMTYAGAKNNTELQMAQTMSYLLPQEKLHPVFNALDLDLASRGQGAKAADGKAFRLNIVNAIWGQTGYTFMPDFLDTLALNYGAGLRLLDFESKPEDSRITINQWVETETENRIKDLLPQGSIDSATRLVLTNAIYFNAAWLEPFKEDNTSKKDFFPEANGTAVSVDMMAGSFETQYTQGTDYQAAQMPYDGNELSMLVIVPDSGKFQSFEQSLDASTIDTILGQMQNAQVNLEFPKFEFTKPLGLKEVLIQMGMTDAFDGGSADFSGINGRRDLVITDVLHKAFVKVNEAGTEAAAATAVIVSETSVPALTVDLKIDRPFIFLIRDHATNAILFVGRVVNPNA